MQRLERSKVLMMAMPLSVIFTASERSSRFEPRQLRQVREARIRHGRFGNDEFADLFATNDRVEFLVRHTGFVQHESPQVGST